MKINWSKVTAGTIARTLTLILSLVNLVLDVFNISPLNITDNNIATFVSVGFVIVTSIIAWWKNNSFSNSAMIADNMMKLLKNVNTASNETIDSLTEKDNNGTSESVEEIVENK